MSNFPISAFPKEAAKWALRRTLMRGAVYHPRPEDRPFYIRLDVTNYCNQVCIKCWVPDKMKIEPAHFMSLDDYKRLADELFAYTYLLQIPCAYEGLMHPQIAELVRIADEAGIPNIGIVTNGVLLRGDRAEALVAARNVTAVNVSIDGIDPDVYRKMRGRHKPEAVLANVESFLAMKRAAGRDNLHLKFNVILARSNAHDLPNVARWAADHGVDEMEFFHVEPMTKGNDESLVNDPEAYRRLHDELGAIFEGRDTRVFLPRPWDPADLDPATGELLRRHVQNEEASQFDTSESDTLDPRYSHPYPTNTFCINPWMVLQIDSWGNIFPCAHRLHLGPLANIVRQGREEALNSYKFMKLRRDHLCGSLDPVCLACKSRSPAADPMRRRMVRVLKEDLEKIAVE